MPLFFADTISLTDSDKSELFVIKEVIGAVKKTIAVVDKDHYAVFFKGENYIDTLGEGKHKIISGNEVNVSAKLIYISKTAVLDVKWATPARFEVSGGIKIGLRGEFNVQISDVGTAYRQLLEDNTYSAEKLVMKLRNRMCGEIQPIVAKVIEDSGVNIIDDCERLSKLVKPSINAIFLKDYGLTLVNFDLNVINENEKA